VRRGALKSFDLPAGLRPVGAGLLHGDVKLRAGGRPGSRLVDRAVVREDPPGGDAAFREPGDGAAQDGGQAAILDRFLSGTSVMAPALTAVKSDLAR
jgi:hypothetical protein